jgi:predicted Zn-dependent protease
MQYENPQPAEGINTSNEHPLKEFAQLVFGLAALAIAAILILNVLAANLAKYIPFEYEQKMGSGFDIVSYEESEQSRYLQAIADKLAPSMDLPEGMTITVHYDESDTVNAFATLGGNLIFFKGLLERIESEQELAALMGHEIAHIKYRHPITALGKGVTIAAFISFIGGASGSSAGEWLIGSSANLSMMKFSREQESRADAAAAEVLYKVYGHIGGAQHLFQRFAEYEGGKSQGNAMIELFRSHPYTEDRWSQLEDLANSQNWPTSGELNALDIFKDPSPASE